MIFLMSCASSTDILAKGNTLFLSYKFFCPITLPVVGSTSGILPPLAMAPSIPLFKSSFNWVSVNASLLGN